MASALGATALQATLISVAFAVTGISAKIDKAATKVFGEDMVKLATIAGSAYAMFNGGFEIGGGEAAASTAANAAAAADDALFNADWAAAAGGDGGLMAGESVAGGSTFNLSDMGSSAASDAAFEADWAAASGADGGLMANETGTNLMTGEPVGVDAKTAASTPTTSAPITDTTPQASGALSSKAAAPQAANAAGPNASAAGATASKAAAPMMTAEQGAQMAKDIAGAQKAAGGSNIFDRLFYTTDKAGNRVFNDRMAGGLIQGVGGAVGSYMQGQQAEEALNWQKQRYTARVGGRVTG